jgi:hypothetical protein
MHGMTGMFRNKKRRTAKMYYAGIMSCMASAAAFGSTITMKNEPIFIKGDTLKTRKGLRT